MNLNDFDNVFSEYFYIILNTILNLYRISQRLKIRSFITLNFYLITLLAI